MLNNIKELYSLDRKGFVKSRRSDKGQLYQEYIRDKSDNVITLRSIGGDNSYYLYLKEMQYDMHPNPFYGLPLFNDLAVESSLNNRTQYTDAASKITRITYQYRPDGYPSRAVVTDPDGSTTVTTYEYDR